MSYSCLKLKLATWGCILLLLPATVKAQNAMQSLDPRQQSLVCLAAFEAKGELDSLQNALHLAFDNGLTVNEAKEALSQLYAYTGFPRSLNALSTLQRVVETRRSEGRSLVEGREASALPDTFNALREGTRVQTQLCGGKPYDYQFVPATDYYLKAHLFGDIFARDVLSFADREIVTISALSSIKGLDAQLKSHVGGSRNMGVTDSQLRAIPEVLRTRVGELEAWRAKKAVASVLGEEFGEGQPVENQLFPIGNPNTAFARYFVGNSYLANIADESAPLFNVTFEPGCRNNWHIHHKAGQVLICVGGEGLYQAWGQPVRRLRPGDVVVVPPEVKHWHGATSHSWFQHIAMEVPAEGRSNEWCEPVSDEAYAAANE